MAQQCKAKTEDGNRCSRSAEENGYCHQHGPDDETVDDADGEQSGDDSTADDTAESETTDDQPNEDAMTQQESSENETDDDEDDGAENAENANADAQSGDGQSQTDEASDGQSQTDNATAGLLEVRDTVRQQVPSLVNKELDTVTAIRSTDDGWQATVELVERHAVPNTQDILGRYEFDLDEDATIVGYRRIETYNRGDQTYDEM